MQNQDVLRAKDELKTALDKYTDLYDFAPLGYFTLDRNGAISAVNLSGASLLGVERSRLLGRRFGLFVAVEARKFFSDFLGNVLVSQTKKSCEVTLTGEGNHPLFVQIEAMADALSKECSIAVIDITERRLVEQERERGVAALQKSEKKFSTIFNSAPVLIGISTMKEGAFIDVNRESLQTLGYRREEIIGKTARELGLWEDDSERAKAMRALKEQGSIRNLEVRFKGKTGRTFTGLYSAEPIDIDEDRYILNLVKDITERKSAEEEVKRLNAELKARAADLAAANMELEAFNYTAAHDLRQPLNVISSYCQAVKEVCGVKLDGQCDAYLQEIYNGTICMNRLIEALLDFSRLAHAELNRNRIDLSALAHEVVMMLKMTEPGRQVDFRIAGGINAHGDAALLRVVLDNLFGNSWKYTAMRDAAVIEFGTEEIDGKPANFVRDNGTGFDMACADTIFAPFKRLPGAEECRGFGIGLATVERIIRRHGGRVWAEGEPGKGATFWFTLPADGVLS
jgi:PAS domain S-box-containing protein